MFQTLICPSSGAFDCVDEYHTGRLVLSSLCVGDLVWLVFSSDRVAGNSLQRCGNSTTQSQAPDDGYINV